MITTSIVFTNGYISNHTTTTWNNGDLITADKLNNLENATKNGLDTLVLDIVIDPANGSTRNILNKDIFITNATTQDIINAFNNGTNIIILVKAENSLGKQFTYIKMTLTGYAWNNSGKYNFMFSFVGDNGLKLINFTAPSLDNYPSYQGTDSV